MHSVTFAILSTGVLLGESTASRGLAIAITGMIIVASALLLIIAFITALPKVLAWVGQYFPESEDAHARPAARQSHPESQVADDDAVLAAIGFVLHTRLQNKE